MRSQLVVFSALLCVTALVAGVTGACSESASVELTSSVDLRGLEYFEKWVINGPWNVTIVEGADLSVVFEGTDRGSVVATLSADNTTLSATFSIAAGGNTPSDVIVATPRPRRQLVSSASSIGFAGLNSIIALVTGLLFARSNKRGLAILAIAFLVLSVTMDTTMAQTPAAECPEAVVTATIPRGLVRQICFNGDSDCICGPGFSGETCEPVAAPTPVATPTAAPTATPVATPVATPTAAPIAPPTAAPVAAPTAAPVAAPIEPPTAAPVDPPTAPIDPPTAAPVAAPIEPPTAPIDPPTAAPIAAPIEPPTAPVDPPVVDPPVTPPTTVDPPTVA